MGTTWTKEQLSAIQDSGNNILVAAAAGSGKTTVLVERIIRKIIDEKIDIDKILVVTFTNAAASEMRERILNALYNEIEKDPLNKQLRKQIVLLNKASICTIDSFCLDVIRNNFFEIGVSSNFRIADNTELELLRQDAIEETFEELYLDEEEEFQTLIENYSGYKDDENLKNIILKIYNFIQSSPFPEDWLEEKVQIFNSNIEKFSETVWAKILLKNFKDELQNSIQILKTYKRKLEAVPELLKSMLIIEDDISQLENLYKNLDNWDTAYEIANKLKFKTWQSDKKVISQLKEESKTARDIAKKRINQAIEKTFIFTEEEAIQDMHAMYKILNKIKEVLLKFIKKFDEKKLEKNIMDFSDIEHNALKILLNKNEKGIYEKTEIAKKYEEKFKEIAIDEYQDSNLVQEYILTAISNNKNIFMVGDVKQSIYRFRQAKPELFLNKYENYGIIPNELGQKIQLFKNFRSRKNVLDITNIVFEDVMSKEFGEIEYNESEYLNLGADYTEPEKKCDFAGKAELDIINLKDSTQDEETDAEEETAEELLEKTEIEAKFIAKKIQELIDKKYQVYDRKTGYRDIKYKDIVILLRATSNTANIFEKELSNLEIPVFSDQANNYLESIEIKNIISLFKIIDNPYRDIPLVTVMRSIIGDFTDNELIEIRLCKKDGHYYDSIKEALVANEIKYETKEKLKSFIEKIEKWREEERYLPLNEFIWKIYQETDYYNYVRLMPNGEVRKANLKMLFDRAKEYEKISFKGLFNFIRYLEKIKNNNSDLSSAKVIGENEDVVRIMSIHKSKGLEFPVAIISRTDKKFNQKDLTDSILMHQDIGFGMQYINYDRQIEYTTAAKEAIKIKIKEESIAEEMRILYVALTRAKEKLIITGVENDLEKSLEQKRELLENYEKENGKINHLILKKDLSYLGWLELVYLNHEDIESYMILNKISKKDILNNEEKIEEKEIRNIPENEEEIEKVNKILNWKYKYQDMTNIQSKMSVTKIKELKSRNKLELEPIEKKPKFMEEKKELSSAEKGTLVHLILQKLDFKKEYTKEQVEQFIQSLYEKEIINKLQKEAVNSEKIYKTLTSEFFKKIQTAKQIYKEVPFYTYINTKEIYNTKNEENILVQGIIDLYYITNEDEIILVDYKTDYVKNEEELIEKYKIQLEIYRKALEESLNKKIKETYIYSIYLNKAIKIL